MNLSDRAWNRLDVLPVTSATHDTHRSQPAPDSRPLLNSATRYQRLFETARDGIFILDSTAGKVIDVNPRGLEMLEYSRAEMMDAPFFESGVFKDSAASRRIFQELQKNGDVRCDVLTLQTKSGQSRDVELLGHIYSDGGRSFIHCDIRDITHRKQAEAGRDHFLMASLDMLAIVNMDGYLQWANPAFVETMGYTESELMSRPFRDRVHPDDGEVTQEAVENLNNGLPLQNLVNRYPAKDGSWRWLEWRSVKVPELGVIYAAARDITQRKEAEAQLQFQKALLEAQSETSLDGILIISDTGKILSYNQHFTQVWGIAHHILADGDERVLREISGRVACPQEFGKRIAALTDEKEERSREELTLRDGRTFDCYSAPIIGENRFYYGRVWYFRDVTEQKQAALELQEANQKLGTLVITDALTGLSNRRALDAALQRDLLRAHKLQKPLSLVLLDVDDFKNYNDSYGHPAGDRVLQEIGRLLREQVRDADTVARYGGEEFAVTLFGADATNAIALAERLRRRIETATIENRAVTASFGVVTLTPETNSVASLLAAADTALYRSKNSGRNQVTHHSEVL
jgi:diguanylate cyclase (GGDEF)-like protein/PAS domain S-box-containing protein